MWQKRKTLSDPSKLLKPCYEGMYNFMYDFKRKYGCLYVVAPCIFISQPTTHISHPHAFNPLTLVYPSSYELRMISDSICIAMSIKLLLIQELTCC